MQVIENGLWKGQILVYDIASVPQGIDIEQIMYMYKQHGVVIYDSFSTSSQTVNAPYIFGNTENIEIQDANI